MQRFAVLGYPIEHSYSPIIHYLFAKQTGKNIHYDRILTPLDDFEAIISDFFASGGSGVNITAPFKERAYAVAQHHTIRASIAGAVNTLKLLEDQSLLGDNTDGLGLLSDLQRLQMIKPNQKVLLLGAGGATRGVLQPLLAFGCQIFISNRTYGRAQNLVQQFISHGSVRACKLEELDDLCFDLIINATSANLQEKLPHLPALSINSQTRCYDMTYQPQLTPFLYWAKQQGSLHVADGLGMLVAQAAHAFFLWQGVLPEIEPVLQQLRREISGINDMSF